MARQLQYFFLRGTTKRTGTHGGMMAFSGCLGYDSNSSDEGYMEFGFGGSFGLFWTILPGWERNGMHRSDDREGSSPGW